MQVVKLHKINDSFIVTLPISVLEVLHLQENDDMAIEIAGDRIMLSRTTSDFQDAWEAYKEIEPRYQNANQKLAE